MFEARLHVETLKDGKITDVREVFGTKPCRTPFDAVATVARWIFAEQEQGRLIDVPAHLDVRKDGERWWRSHKNYPYTLHRFRDHDDLCYSLVHKHPIIQSTDMVARTAETCLGVIRQRIDGGYL